MGQPYHPSIYDTRPPIESYWAETAGPEVEDCAPLAGDEVCDVAIIGGGYTGLSTALHLARDYGIEARVLEAGPIGWGASGRNGGFCCMGAAKLSLAEMVRRFGKPEAERYLAAQREAIELVRALGADEGIDFEPVGDGEIEAAHKPARLADLAAYRDYANRTFGLDIELWSKEELAERAYRGPEAHGAIRFPFGFALHPMKYVRGLARAAQRRGAVIHAESRVLAWSREGGRHVLVTAGGRLEARRVVMAGNGFMPEDLHPAFRGAPVPVLSNIIVTCPLSAEQRVAHGFGSATPIFDSRNLLSYFRLLPDGRFLFGGRGGASADPATLVRRRAWLTRRFHAMFPAWREVEISHFWRGLACVAMDRLPHVGRLEDDASVYYGFAYHGNGVATASWSGRAIAGLIAGRNAPDQLPAVFAQPIRRVLLPALRPWYLRLVYAGYALRDGLT